MRGKCTPVDELSHKESRIPVREYSSNISTPTSAAHLKCVERFVKLYDAPICSIPVQRRRKPNVMPGG